MLYSIRGYQEDTVEGNPPGQLFDVTFPVWRIGEGILFASRFAETFDGVEGLAVRCRFTGLSGRSLVSLSGARAVFGDDTSRSTEIDVEAQASMQRIKDNLVEVLHQLLVPLYERFNFMHLPVLLVDQELARMARGRF